MTAASVTKPSLRKTKYSCYSVQINIFFIQTACETGPELNQLALSVGITSQWVYYKFDSDVLCGKYLIIMVIDEIIEYLI